ncbi:MAG: hypothetical protein V4619_00430 [Bacteroidota bacterium]
MKPTKAEKQWLRKHLNGLLHYSETCAEFYDHILTSAEHHADGDFKHIVNNIIENELGGEVGMAAIEWRYHTTATTDIQKKYWLYLKAFLSLKSIPLVITGFALIYWITVQTWFTSGVFMTSFLSFSMMVTLLSGARHFRTGFVYGFTKASVKDDGFSWMKKAPSVLFFGVIFFNFIFRYSLDIQPVNQPLVVTIVFSLLSLHTLTFYKIYREQFKISFI